MKFLDWWFWFIRLVGIPLLVCHTFCIDILWRQHEYGIALAIVFDIFGLFWVYQSKSIRKEFFNDERA